MRTLPMVTPQSLLGRKPTSFVVLTRAQDERQSSEKDGCCQGLYVSGWRAGEAGGTLVSIPNPSIPYTGLGERNKMGSPQCLRR